MEYLKAGISEFREETTDFYGNAQYVIDAGTYVVTYGPDHTTERGKYLNVWTQGTGAGRSRQTCGTRMRQHRCRRDPACQGRALRCTDGRVVTRVQLSLYLPEPGARAIEAVRLVLDPVQHRLIPAHVTLCREGELAQVDRRSLATRLAAFPAGALTLGFGMPEPFHEHGILLPCIAGEEEFRELRQHVLGSRRIRHQAPHITLAHPRNPRAAGNCLANARTLPGKLEIVLASANLIEQAGASAWRVLDTIAFGAA